MKDSPEQAKRYKDQLANARQTTGLDERARALSNVAIDAAKAGKWDEAFASLREAISLCNDCPSLPLLHKNLGLIQFQAGRLDDGEKELRIAMAGLPDDPQIQQALATIARLRSQ